MNYIFKNTKIVSTSGPAITKELNIESDLEKHGEVALNSVLEMFDNIFYKGVNCIRFNFSHSAADQRLFRIKLINWAQEKLIERTHSFLTSKKQSNLKFVRPISNMCDTKGPEIRVYKIDNSSGEEYKKGSTVFIHCIEKVSGDKNKFSVVDSSESYNMSKDCVVGNKILLDDGKLSLKIISVESDKGIVEAIAENTHTLKTNKRINLPGADYSMPFLSNTDIADIKFAVDNGFDLIALSFVNKAQNIEDVKKILTERVKKGQKLPAIYSKIETLYSLKNLDEIIAASDGIMIARGDLGLEIPYFEVPYWTKVIIKKCAIKNIPVIVATQMLDSLERTIIPTRAEVTDVYRAAELGSDATMLSGETAQGLFPLIAVETMSSILMESEKNSNYEKFFNHFIKHPKFEQNSKLVASITQIYNSIKENSDVAAVVVFAKDVDKEFIDAYSACKLPISLIVFESVESYQESLKNYSFSQYSIHRSIYKIGVINLTAQISIEECFEDYFLAYNYKQVDSFQKSQILVFDGIYWKIAKFKHLAI